MADMPSICDAQAGYRRANVAGLGGQDTLQRGLHAIVLYLVRAQAAVEHVHTDPDAERRALHAAASADRLLTFMARIADPTTDLGSRLIRCYVGIQLLITRALPAIDTAADDVFGQAIVQARVLEHSLSSPKGHDHG